eukprot:SAG22_NODE_185_length_15941_cov_8.668034_3_plen_2595_part_00
MARYEASELQRQAALDWAAARREEIVAMEARLAVLSLEPEPPEPEPEPGSSESEPELPAPTLAQNRFLADDRRQQAAAKAEAEQRRLRTQKLERESAEAAQSLITDVEGVAAVMDSLITDVEDIAAVMDSVVARVEAQSKKEDGQPASQEPLEPQADEEGAVAAFGAANARSGNSADRDVYDIIAAAKSGNLEHFEFCIEFQESKWRIAKTELGGIGTVWDAKDADGANLLHVSANGQLLTRVLTLMQRPPSNWDANRIEQASAFPPIDEPNRAGFRPLHVHVAAGRTEFVRLLLHFGARPGLAVKSPTLTTSGDTPVMMASAAGHIEILELLLAAVAKVGPSGGNDLNQTNNRGETALHMACTAGQFECARILLASGADPNFVAKGGSTCLHLCAASGQVRMAKLMLTSCDVNSQNDGGATPLHYAAQFGRHGVAALLLRGKANARAATRFTRDTPLHIAAKHGHTRVLELLLELDRVDPSAVDHHERTALHHVVGVQARYPAAQEVSRLERDNAQADVDTRRKNLRALETEVSNFSKRLKTMYSRSRAEQAEKRRFALRLRKVEAQRDIFRESFDHDKLRLAALAAAMDSVKASIQEILSDVCDLDDEKERLAQLEVLREFLADKRRGFRLITNNEQKRAESRLMQVRADLQKKVTARAFSQEEADVQVLEHQAKTAAARKLNATRSGLAEQLFKLTAGRWSWENKSAYLCADVIVGTLRLQLNELDAIIHDVCHAVSTKLLLRASPGEVRSADDLGRIPLHWAELSCAPEQIKKQLIDLFPHGALERDHSHATPAALRPAALHRTAMGKPNDDQELRGCEKCRGLSAVLCSWDQLAEHEKLIARQRGWSAGSWDQVQPARCDVCVRRGIKSCLEGVASVLTKGTVAKAISNVSSTIAQAERHPQLLLACLSLRADLFVLGNDIWAALNDMTTVIGASRKLQIGDRIPADEQLAEFTQTQWHIVFEPENANDPTGTQRPVPCPVGRTLEHPMPQARLYLRRGILHSFLRQTGQMHEDYIAAEDFGIDDVARDRLVAEISNNWELCQAWKKASTRLLNNWVKTVMPTPSHIKTVLERSGDAAVAHVKHYTRRVAKASQDAAMGGLCSAAIAIENKTPWVLKVKRPNTTLHLLHVLKTGDEWLQWLDKHTSSADEDIDTKTGESLTTDVLRVKHLLELVKRKIGFCFDSSVAQSLQSVAQKAVVTFNELETEREDLMLLIASDDADRRSKHSFRQRLHDYGDEFEQLKKHLERCGPYVRTHLVTDQWAFTKTDETQKQACCHMPFDVHTNEVSVFGSQSVLMKDVDALSHEELEKLCPVRPSSISYEDNGDDGDDVWRRAAINERHTLHTHSGRCEFLCSDLITGVSCTVNLVWEVTCAYSSAHVASARNDEGYHTFGAPEKGEDIKQKTALHFRAWSECEGDLHLAVNQVCAATEFDGQLTVKFEVELGNDPESTEDLQESEAELQRKVRALEADKLQRRQKRLERAVRHANGSFGAASTMPGAPELCYTETQNTIWAEWHPVVSADCTYHFEYCPAANHERDHDTGSNRRQWTAMPTRTNKADLTDLRAGLTYICRVRAVHPTNGAGKPGRQTIIQIPRLHRNTVKLGRLDPCPKTEERPPVDIEDVSLVVVGGHGQDARTGLTQVVGFVQHTQCWTALPPLPVGIIGPAVCPTTSPGGIFVAGGYTPGVTGAQQHSTVHAFNHYGQQHWEALPSMRGARAGASACLLIGWRAGAGKLVSVAHDEGDQDEDDDDEFWLEDGDEEEQPAVVLVFGGHLDVIDESSGKVERLPLGTVEAFDHVSGVWIQLPSMKLARTAFGSCVLSDGRVMVAGGAVGSKHKPVVDVEIFDPLENAWQHSCPLRLPRVGCGLCRLPLGEGPNGRGGVAVVGGATPQSVLELVAVAELGLIIALAGRKAFHIKRGKKLPEANPKTPLTPGQRQSLMHSALRRSAQQGFATLGPMRQIGDAQKLYGQGAHPEPEYERVGGLFAGDHGPFKPAVGRLELTIAAMRGLVKTFGVQPDVYAKVTLSVGGKSVNVQRTRTISRCGQPDFGHKMCFDVFAGPDGVIKTAMLKVQAYDGHLAESDTHLTESTQCYVVSGIKTDPSINGTYSPNGQTKNGCAIYALRDESKVLYWQPDNEGQWIIAAAVGSGICAVEQDGASPRAVDGPSSKVWTIGSVHEPAVTITVADYAELLAEFDIPVAAFAGDRVLGNVPECPHTGPERRAKGCGCADVRPDHWHRMQRRGYSLRAFEDPHVHLFYEFEPAPLLLTCDGFQHTNADKSHDLSRAWGLLRRGYLIQGRAKDAPPLQLFAQSEVELQTAGVSAQELTEASHRIQVVASANEPAMDLQPGDTTEDESEAAAGVDEEVAAAAVFVQDVLSTMIGGETVWPLRPEVRAEIELRLADEDLVKHEIREAHAVVTSCIDQIGPRHLASADVLWLPAADEESASDGVSGGDAESVAADQEAEPEQQSSGEQPEEPEGQIDSAEAAKSGGGWQPLPDMKTPRYRPAICPVTGGFAVVGGVAEAGDGINARVCEPPESAEKFLWHLWKPGHDGRPSPGSSDCATPWTGLPSLPIGMAAGGGATMLSSNR